MPAGSQQVTQQFIGDTAGAAAIEKRKRFLVVGGGLIVFISHGGCLERRSGQKRGKRAKGAEDVSAA